MRIVVYVLLAMAAATTVLSLAGFNIDLALANLLYDPVNRHFIVFNHPALRPLREHGFVAIGLCVVVIILGVMRLLPWRLPSIPPRNALALTLSLIIGPGLLVNGILKPHGGRPRPIEITQFGGDLRFVDWWSLSGGCDGNCSFMSGEATTAAWTIGPAMLVPPPWRGLAIGASLVFTAIVGILRIAAGGHFFTDVLIGALATILIVLGTNRLLGVRDDGRG